MSASNALLRSPLLIALAMVLLALVPLAAQAQSWDPYTSNAIIAPAPLAPVEFGGTGTFTFQAGNNGGSVLPFPPPSGNPMGLEISLANGVPNVADPNDSVQALTAISGPLLAYFDFTYNPVNRTYTGTQKAPIPAFGTYQAVIQYRLTANTFIGSPFNGANVNVQPPGFTNPQPTDNDQASSYTYVEAKDYGDAPISYGQAGTTIDLTKTAGGAYNQYVYLGAVVDPEPGYQASVDALGDDDNRTGGLNADDEDGVVFPPSLTPGQTYSIPVTATLNGASFAALNAWIDWNNSGTFDAGEQVITNQLFLASGTQNNSITVPPGTPSGTYYARFRLGTFSLNATQMATWGEVEDYRISVGGAAAPAIWLNKVGTLNTGLDGIANAGDTITYTFAVQNTGNVPLTNVTVTDPKVTVSGGSLATLAAGATDSTTFTGTYILTQTDIDAGSFTNTATATGTPPTGPNVTDPDDDTQTWPRSPTLVIDKVLTNANPSPIVLGSVLTYTVTARNTGNVTLTNVVVSDNLISPSSTTCASVAPTGTCVLTGTYTVTQANVNAGKVDNVGTADSDQTDPVNKPLSTPITQNSTLSLDKTATPKTYTAAGQVISYSYLLNNTGSVTLSAPFAVADNKVTVTCPGTPITLAPGESITCTATYTIQPGDLTAGSVTNTATATGKDPQGNTVTSNQDSETVTALRAAIGNRVWLDENGNGIQDAGEDGIANLTVNLTGAGPDGVIGTGDDVSYPSQTTDTDGGYLFTNLPPGTYRVTVTPLAGLNPTYDEDGTGTPNVTDVINVTAGAEHLTADFGYNWVPKNDSTNPEPTTTGAIGDRVWNDADGNGRQDPGESGIANVDVTLYYDPDGNGVYDTPYPNALDGNGIAIPTGTTTTDAAGNYIFDNLPQGAYVVKVNMSTLPSGPSWTQTGDPDGPSSLDSQTTQPILLAPGDVYVNADFGYEPSQGSTIGNLIYLDANGNGLLDTGEPGIAGVTVALLDSTGKVIATTITSDGTTDVDGDTVIDPAGTYLFPGLPSGPYTVVVTDTNHVLGEVAQTVDHDGGNDGKSTITVDGTSNYLDQDFGYAPPGQTSGKGMIGDTIFLDRDSSNTFNAGEGLEGVKVTLYDSTGTTPLATTYTNENGYYGFGGLNPTGTYVVKVDTTTLPNGGTGLTNTVDPDAGTANQSTVTLSGSGINLNQDFGYRPTTPNIVGGTLWVDSNGNGVLDGSELGRFGGVTIVLTRNVAGVVNVVGTTVTAPNGDYFFTGLPDGEYTVDVTDDANLLAGYWHSLGIQGSNDNSQPDPYTVTVTGGQTNTTGDFGYFIDGAALGNRVWKDNNGNGIQDTGEPGLPGVLLKIVITYPNGAQTTAYTTSASNGGYSFGNLLLDENFNGGTGSGQPTYVISVVNTPTGYTASPQGQGTPNTDSNNPAGTTAFVDRGQTNTAVNSNPSLEPPNASYDFGYTPLQVTTQCGAVTALPKQPYGTPAKQLTPGITVGPVVDPNGIVSINCYPTSGTLLTSGYGITATFDPALPSQSTTITVMKNSLTADPPVSTSGNVRCDVTDQLGQITPCDPFEDTVTRTKAMPGTTTAEIDSSETYVQVTNGKPGLTQLEVYVNGQRFKLVPMRDEQTYGVDISSALKDLPPESTVTVYLTAKGKPGTEADILIYPPSN